MVALTYWRSGIVVVVIGACAPVRTATRDEAAPQPATLTRSPPRHELKVDATTATLSMTLANVVTCGEKHEECARTPAAAVALGLVVPTTGGAPAFVALGATDASGRLATAWATVVAQLPATATADAKIVDGGADAPVLASVIAPVNDPEVGWQAASKTDTAAAYRSYHQRFPQGAHAGEAETRARTIAARDAQRDFDAAIAGDNVDLAGAALEVLRANADPATAATAQERLDKLQVAVRAKRAREQLAALFAAIDAAADPAIVVAQIRTAIEGVRAVDPELAATSEAQLVAARDRLVARYVREGKEAAAARDFPTATKRFATAITITGDVKTVERARTSAFEAALKTGYAAARDLAGKRQYAEAVAIVESLLAIAPQNPALQADRTRWAAARDRASRLEEARRDKPKTDEPKLVKAEPPMPPPPPPPATVQFTLPARAATADAMAKLPVPAGCQVAIATYLARPSTCKDDCAPRTVTRATMTCAAHKLVFVRDRANVWLTCDGGRPCADCLATGRGALAALVDARDTLEVVQGCTKP